MNFFVPPRGAPLGAAGSVSPGAFAVVTRLRIGAASDKIPASSDDQEVFTMRPLYSEQDYSHLKSQLNRRRLVFAGIFAAAAALFIVTLAMDDRKANRPELLSTFAVIFGGAALIFFWDLAIHPLSAYASHMDAALHGRSHETTVIFDRVGGEESIVEGVAYRDLFFLGEPDKHGIREQMFYWDSELPIPSFTPGREVTVRYFDRFIIAYSE